MRIENNIQARKISRNQYKLLQIILQLKSMTEKLMKGLERTGECYIPS